MKTFDTWKTIKLGTGLKTANDFRRAFREAECRVGQSIDEALGSLVTFRVASEQSEVHLVNVSVGDLESCQIHNPRDHVANIKEIHRSAQQLGLNLCSLEVGFQLRLQYLDQPKEKTNPPYGWLHIGMNPIITAAVGAFARGPQMFILRNYENKLWLSVSSAIPEELFDREDRFVFLQSECKN